MAAFEREGDRAAFEVDGLLLLENGGSRFEPGAHVDFVSVADAAQDTAAVVAGETFGGEGIVVFTPFEPGALDAAADLHRFGGVDPHHRFGENGVEFVVERLAPTGRHARRTGQDDAADGVVGCLGPKDRLLLGRLRFGIEGVERTAAGVVEIVASRGDAVDLQDPRLHADPQLGEHPFGDGAGGDPRGGLPCGAASAAAVVPDTVFLPVGKVGVPGTKDPFDVLVIPAFLIAVVDHHRDGGSGAFPFESPRKDLHPIGLFAGGGERTLPRAASVELALDEGFVDRQTRRQAVEDAADGPAVGFAECRHHQAASETVHRFFSFSFFRAISAAFCWALFLLCPLAVAMVSPPRSTATSNSLRWSGPRLPRSR